MKLYFIGHDYKYAAEQIMLTLFPGERPEYSDAPGGSPGAVIAISRGDKYLCAVCRLTLDGSVSRGEARCLLPPEADPVAVGSAGSRLVKLCFYRAALRAGVARPVWGSLTGVRPAKLITRSLDAGLSPAASVSRLCADYDCSRRRALLCLDAAQAARRAREGLDRRDICLYVGIPFCPTRCAYCSFVSNSVEKSAALIAPFLDALEEDVDATAQAVRESGLRPVALYIGGGTPTTLSAGQLDRLMSRLEQAFDLSAVGEITVEAGRPDTISRDKLLTLRSHGVTRISVNPQTMSDSVLDAIGRRHSARDVLDALELARGVGGFDVNMDLIAGLPTDTPDGFSRTLDAVLSLSPENITVHTLSLKKGSRISEEGSALPSAAEVAAMLDEAGLRLRDSRYSPYYLYRQKFMSGGFENVGWSLPGHESIYNICIMEELCGIISMGGGASTKLVRDGRIARVFSPKYPREYIEMRDKVRDKTKIKEFYYGFSAH